MPPSPLLPASLPLPAAQPIRHDALAAQRQLVEALRDPARYGYPVQAVAVIETHISFVLLTGPFAYKIKKAVDLGFVDYTRLDDRRFFCREELRLNGRLAPELYLDVVGIGGSPENPRWQNGGPCIEYAVRMAQFDQADRLDRVLAQGELQPGDIDALAATLADFHGQAPAAPRTWQHGTPAAIWVPVQANFSRLRQVPNAAAPRCLDRLEAWSRAEFGRLEENFAQRRAAGFVRECHGDLHLGNMARFGGRTLVFDGIEFNPGLRWIDIMSDLAFLVMDLSERGRRDYAWRLLNEWLERTGDYAGLQALRFYQVYRALVRAKVAGIRAGDAALPPAGRQAALAECTAYLDHAAGLVAPRSGALLVTHGLAGAGKTTVARSLAQSLGAVRLRSDVERKRLHGLAPLAPSASGPGAGLYGEAETAATYGRLAELAAQALTAGYWVVVDAACLKRWQRDRFRDLARALGVACLILDCRAPARILKQRVAARAARGTDASEATPAVLARQRREAEPLAADEETAAMAVDTTRNGLEQVAAAIRRRLAGGA